jgi:hypothetical protein
MAEKWWRNTSRGRRGTRRDWGERGEGRGERYSYEKADTVPVVVVDEEKKKVAQNLVHYAL